MREDWLVVGISGVTCAGKTTITKALHSMISNSFCIYQDLYFRSPDDKNHIFLEELQHNNWELLTAVDTDKLWSDIQAMLERPRIHASSRNVLLLDGFLILNFHKIAELCDLKFYLKLTKEECWERRKKRSYDPPDVPGYFEKVVWPEHLKSFKAMCELNDNVTIMDGGCSIESSTERINCDINCRLK